MVTIWYQNGDRASGPQYILQRKHDRLGKSRDTSTCLHNKFVSIIRSDYSKHCLYHVTTMTAMTQPVIPSAQCCIIAFRPNRKLIMVRWTLNSILLPRRSAFPQKGEACWETLAYFGRSEEALWLRPSRVTNYRPPERGERGKAWPHPAVHYPRQSWHRLEMHFTSILLYGGVKRCRATEHLSGMLQVR